MGMAGARGDGWSLTLHLTWYFGRIILEQTAPLLTWRLEVLMFANDAACTALLDKWGHKTVEGWPSLRLAQCFGALLLTRREMVGSVILALWGIASC